MDEIPETDLPALKILDLVKAVDALHSEIKKDNSTVLNDYWSTVQITHLKLENIIQQNMERKRK